MTQQVINNGSAAGDGQGENLFSAFAKVNANFTELYALPSGGSPAGLTNYIQYNASGAFAASIKYQWNDTTNTMTLGTGLNSTIQYIKTGAPTAQGNPLYLVVPSSVGTGSAPGADIRLYAGDASPLAQTGVPAGGNVYIYSGAGGGDFGYGLFGAGGSFQLRAGDGSAGGDYGPGGSFAMYAGTGYGQIAGNGGGFNFTAGDAGVSGDGGGFGCAGGNAATDGNGGNVLFGSGIGAGTGVNGDIQFRPGGTLKGTYSGATRGLTLLSSTSGFTLDVKASGTAATAAIQAAGTSAGEVALRINTSATTGAQTATFTATNKPGTATTAPTKWLPINLDGVKYYIPCWT